MSHSFSGGADAVVQGCTLRTSTAESSVNPQKLGPFPSFSFDLGPQGCSLTSGCLMSLGLGSCWPFIWVALRNFEVWPPAVRVSLRTSFGLVSLHLSHVILAQEAGFHLQVN